MKEEIAKERVDALFSRARKDKKSSKRYVLLARKIAMRARYRLPKETKRSFCKGCNAILDSGNCRIRADSKTRTMVYTCLGCGTLKRFKY